MAAVQALCGRGIWLDRGEVAADGRVAECVGRYLSATPASHNESTPTTVRLGESLELSSVTVSPNPVESGASMRFGLTLAARSSTRISELALLVYSSQEMRVAIVDLRSSGLPVSLPPGGTWTVGGSIDSLPLVEGAYRIGIGVNATGFAGDRLGLVELQVTALPRPGRYSPYDAAFRGVVELNAKATASAWGPS